MKKVIGLSLLMFLIFAAGVSADTLNGVYKGNPIVKVLSNGVALETDEVPAHIVDGHTMVPISLLRQIGASVTWDVYDYSVDVKLPQQTSQATMPDVKKLRADLIDEVSYIEYTANSVDDFTQLSFSLKFDAPDLSQIAKYQKVLETVGYSTVKQIRLEDQSPNGSIYFIKTQNMKEFKENRMNIDEFNRRVEIHSKSNGQAPPNTSNTQRQPITNQQPIHTNPVQQPSQQPSTQPNTSQQPVQEPPTAQQPPQQPVQQPAQQTPDPQQQKALMCQRISEDYSLKLASFDRNNDPNSGSTKYKRGLLEHERDNELMFNGCN